MKTLIYQIFLLSVVTSTLKSQGDCSNICNWPKVYLQGGTLNCGSNQVIFEDNFDGSQLNTNKWQTYLWDINHTVSRIHNPCEEQIYLDQNVFVSNGTCKLTGKYEPGTTWTNSEGTTFVRDITSGVIQHVSDDNFRFAKYEARIKIPGAGWWPAFWMWHHDEVDIFENFWNKTEYNYNLYGSDECPFPNKHNVNLNDGNFHTFAVEITPFSITYFCDGVALPMTFHRFHKLDGTPLIINCDNNTIPNGTFYINPAFIQIRERHFRPIINLAVLPRYGLCGCPYQNGCSSPLCFLCPTETPGVLGNCDWGYPINTNCEITGDIPATMEIDYVRYTSRDYNLCGSLGVYGDNCMQTGLTKEPLSCSRVCNGTMSNLYLEDITGKNFLSQVSVLNVTSSNDVTIHSFDNYRIQYTRNHYNGNGEIYIHYNDICSNNLLTYKIKNNFEYIINSIDACKGNADITLENVLSNCNYSNFELVNLFLSNSAGNPLVPSYSLQNNNLKINFAGYYLVRTITLNIRDLCTGETFPIRIEIPKCDECCPNGFEYDGANCYSNFTFVGVTGFIENNNFYTTKNCVLYSSNGCCPPGTVPEGNKCLYGPVESGFVPFVLNGSFYTKTNCNKSCCPKGYIFDGKNCYSKFHFYGVNGIIDNGKFFTTRNCELYLMPECCPPGTVLQGSRCYYGDIPPGYTGFILNNSFYVKPNCNICCPPDYIYDGANCYSKKHFSGVEIFILENNFYTSKNCELYYNNDCCPPGTVSQGSRCLIGPVPEGYIGFILGNSYYVKAKNCFDHINLKNDEDGQLESRISDIHNENESLIQIFPNPFGDEFFIRIGEKINDINKILIHDVNGALIKEINKVNVTENINVKHLGNIGIYFVTVSTASRDVIFKVIKSN